MASVRLPGSSGPTCAKESRGEPSIQSPPALMPHYAVQSMHCASVGRVDADAAILHCSSTTQVTHQSEVFANGLKNARDCSDTTCCTAWPGQ